MQYRISESLLATAYSKNARNEPLMPTALANRHFSAAICPDGFSGFADYSTAGRSERLSRGPISYLYIEVTGDHLGSKGLGTTARRSLQSSHRPLFDHRRRARELGPVQQLSVAFRSKPQTGQAAPRGQPAHQASRQRGSSRESRCIDIWQVAVGRQLPRRGRTTSCFRRRGSDGWLTAPLFR